MARQSWFNGIFFGDATYGDDFSPEENYLSVGFRPGYALQSRELLEIQNNILYQLSATNRSLFKHGEPRIDIEEESLSVFADSPITVDGNTFTFKRNIQLFTNFSLPVGDPGLPNGFWITFPIDNTEDVNYQETVTLPDGLNTNIFWGIEITRDIVEDNTLNDPAAGQFGNSNAPGATRFQYKIQDQSATTVPYYGITNLDRRPQAQAGNPLFIPIAKYIVSTGTWYWAFDETDNTRIASQ
jgi:hypothetical protein